MTITFTIPADKISRISAMLDWYGYKFDSASGITDANQRIAFFKKMAIDNWTSNVFNYERNMAINTVNDSAALQAKRFTDLSTITATWV